MVENNSCPQIRLASDLHGVVLKQCFHLSDHLIRVPFTDNHYEQLENLKRLGELGITSPMVTLITNNGSPLKPEEYRDISTLPTKNQPLIKRLATWLGRHRDRENFGSYTIDKGFREGAKLLSENKEYNVSITIVTNLLKRKGGVLMGELDRYRLKSFLDKKMPALLRTSAEVNQVLAKATAIVECTIRDGKPPLFLDNDVPLLHHLVRFFELTAFTPTSQAEGDRQMDDYRKFMKTNGHEIFYGLERSPRGEIIFDSSTKAIAQRLSETIPAPAGYSLKA